MCNLHKCWRVLAYCISKNVEYQDVGLGPMGIKNIPFSTFSVRQPAQKVGTSPSCYNTTPAAG